MNYKVYQGDELKQTVTSKTAVMNGLQPNKSYDFSVEPDNGQTSVVGANLIVQSDLKNGWLDTSGNLNVDSGDFNSENYIATNGETVFTFSSPDYAFKGNGTDDRIIMYDSNKNYLGYQPLDSPTQTLSNPNVAYIRFSINSVDEGGTYGKISDWLANHRYKLEKGSVATRYIESTSVTTRGIQFNIPKTLTVGSNIALRYEEYPLGIVPIGNEPAGYFGGGNKQSLSAKVISTANGSSVVEVAGNVIDVGGRNLLTGTGHHTVTGTNTGDYLYNGTTDDLLTLFKGLEGQTVTVSVDYEYSGFVAGSGRNRLGWETQIDADSTSWFGPWYSPNNDSGSGRIFSTFVVPENITGVDESMGYIQFSGSGIGTLSHLKLEFNDIATPYAAFVDGDTFTAQPDGTCALFSEHKAIYY